jgi:hypothetical protein
MKGVFVVSEVSMDHRDHHCWASIRSAVNSAQANTPLFPPYEFSCLDGSADKRTLKPRLNVRRHRIHFYDRLTMRSNSSSRIRSPKGSWLLEQPRPFGEIDTPVRNFYLKSGSVALTARASHIIWMPFEMLYPLHFYLYNLMKIPTLIALTEAVVDHIRSRWVPVLDNDRVYGPIFTCMYDTFPLDRSPYGETRQRSVANALVYAL